MNDLFVPSHFFPQFIQNQVTLPLVGYLLRAIYLLLYHKMAEVCEPLE
jgi:hypothetical protein